MQLSASNEKREKAYTAHVAEFDLVMQVKEVFFPLHEQFYLLLPRLEFLILFSFL